MSWNGNHIDVGPLNPLSEDAAARFVMLPSAAASAAGHVDGHGGDRGRLGGGQRRQRRVEVGREGAPAGGGGGRGPAVQLRDGRAGRAVRVQVTGRENALMVIIL